MHTYSLNERNKARLERCVQGSVIEAFKAELIPQPSAIFKKVLTEEAQLLPSIAGKAWSDLDNETVYRLEPYVMELPAYRYYIQAKLLVREFGQLGNDIEDIGLSSEAIPPGRWLTKFLISCTLEQRRALYLFVKLSSILGREHCSSVYQAFWNELSDRGFSDSYLMESCA